MSYADEHNGQLIGKVYDRCPLQRWSEFVSYKFSGMRTQALNRIRGKALPAMSLITANDVEDGIRGT